MSGEGNRGESAHRKRACGTAIWWPAIGGFVAGVVVGVVILQWAAFSGSPLFETLGAIAEHDHADEQTTAHNVDSHDHDEEQAEASEHDHAPGEPCDETHDHEAEDEPHAEEPETVLELSEQARKNIDLKVVTVARGLFVQRKSVPAVVVEVPGRSRTVVSAPITGIIERVEPVAGQVVAPGDTLFTLRLTHEDLVEKQSRFLESLEAADVVRREIARLEQVTQSGVVAGKQLLERKYELEKLDAALHAEREALLLHGLSA
ncbi:MAG: hypothetical protein D6741_04800, partial [Planctomycetota bacterium]